METGRTRQWPAAGVQHLLWGPAVNPSLGAWMKHPSFIQSPNKMLHPHCYLIVGLAVGYVEMNRRSEVTSKPGRVFASGTVSFRDETTESTGMYSRRVPEANPHTNLLPNKARPRSLGDILSDADGFQLTRLISPTVWDGSVSASRSR